MPKFKKFLDQNSPFLVNYALFLMAGFWFCANFEKVEGHVILNGFHGEIGDALFPVLTKFGEAALVVTLVIITPFISWRTFITFACAYLIGGIIVLLGKYLIFNDVVRPKTIMEGIANFHFVEGVKLRSLHSFPSGHTQTGFTVFFFTALLLKNASLKRVCWVFAILIGFSRVYISQHFLEDIIAGSLIAVVCTSASYLFWQGKKNKWLDKSLLTKKL